MKKIFLALLTSCACMACHASYSQCHDAVCITSDDNYESLSLPPSTYLDGTYSGLGIKYNWFASASLGASCFLGSPLGCTDLDGRIKPCIRVGLGKWFTPTVGSRIAFEGFRIKASDMSSQNYTAYHLDFLWNISPYIFGVNSNFKLDIVPFFGVGCVRNSSLGNDPFGLAYGINVQYALTNSLRASLELSNITTSKCFDGHSMRKGLGDHILGLSAGISVSIGNYGFKRVVDPAPFVAENERLVACSFGQNAKIRELEKTHGQDLRVIAELKKILQLEGLLKKYGNRIPEISMSSVDGNVQPAYPKNDYSGLNSLMERMRESKKNNDSGDLRYVDMLHGNADRHKDSGMAIDGLVSYEDYDSCKDDQDSCPLAARSNSGEDNEWNDYIHDISSSKTCIGAPIFFFFRIGTSILTDQSQLINIEEISRIAVAYKLKVKVVGSADSFTGSEPQNKTLSDSRARFIADRLKAYGVPDESLILQSIGGNDAYDRPESNRNTRIELYR